MYTCPKGCKSQAHDSGCETTISIYTFLLYLIPCIVCNTSRTLGRTLQRFFRIWSSHLNFENFLCLFGFLYFWSSVGVQRQILKLCFLLRELSWLDKSKIKWQGFCIPLWMSAFCRYCWSAENFRKYVFSKICKQCTFLTFLWPIFLVPE